MHKEVFVCDRPMNRFVTAICIRKERSSQVRLLSPIYRARSSAGYARRLAQVQLSRAPWRWQHGVLLALLILGLLQPQPLWSQTASPMATSTSVDHSAPPTATPNAEQLAQQTITDHVNQVFDAMSPADRVGQLFVITFDGNQIAQNSDIVRLIHQERIGGVVLSPTKHNFTNTKGENTPVVVAQLINQLQALTYGYLVQPEQALTLPLTSSLPFSGTIPLAKAAPSPAVPLLVGVEQQGDGYPATALRRGFTALPSQMALGATWNPPLVQAVGKIVGQELQAVGVNLLLGPNLDVVDEPRNDPVGALGLYSFGGDPYWVSQLGRAYIAGVHDGSGNGVATIARHFPGQGDIDRFPDKEVATVQKSLNELRTISLPPFTQVTRQISSILAVNGDPAATDGLMTSHMRFSALQGVTSGRTVPMSLNPDLQMLLGNEGLGDWYSAGGIMMTNGLGLPAIRRYYEATLNEFAYKRVALDAFVAGHDLLYLTHLSDDGTWATEKQYLQELLQFFRERYKKEAEFRVQVDHAVHRILRLKIGLYQDQLSVQTRDEGHAPTVTPLMLVPPLQVLRRPAHLALFAENSPHRTEAADTLSQVTRAAITLLYPDVENLSDVIAAPPQANDQLLIFSDSRLFSECEGCIAETALGPEELKSIITRLYGSELGATGQIDPARVYGRSFVELGALLDMADANAGLRATNTITDIGATQPLTDAQIVSTPVNDALADDGSVSTEDLLTANERLQRLINESNWIIFAMLDVDPSNKSGSDVVKRFLRQQSEQLGNKQVIVLALNAPYFLDATEISKLTAYFGVYSKTQPFLESAIRAIFRSATVPGAPPVSVPGTRFNNLSAQLQPDPLNPLHLRIYVGETELTLPTNTEEPAPLLQVGDPLRLEVSHVLDHNGHPVPDGVKVEFQLVYEGRDMTIPAEPTFVRNGSATQTVMVEQPGRLLLSASAGAAKTAAPVTVRIQDLAVATNATVPLTTTLVNGSEGTGTGTITATLPVTQTGMSTLPGESDPANGHGVNVTTLVIAFLTILVTLSLLLILQIRILPRAMLVQNMLWATIFGLSAYILYGLHILPGIVFLQDSLRVWGAAVVVFISMLLPLLWLQLRAE